MELPEKYGPEDSFGKVETGRFQAMECCYLSQSSQETSRNLLHNGVSSSLEGASMMRSVEVVQQMIDWMEENMDELPTLQKVSAAVGYSPWYCSCMFHDVTGMTMK